jgi:hypothetical protein
LQQGAVCDKKHKDIIAIWRLTTMLVKRLLLAIISLTIGFIATVLIVWYICDTTVAEYGTIYTSTTALSLACAVGIWLDKFMETQLLPK